MTNYAHNTKGGGYLLIDHQASPGLPEDVALKIGLEPSLVGEGKVLEADTLTCAHCKCVLIKNPLRVRERASCLKCGSHYICDLCSAKSLEPGYSHFPYDKFRDLTLEGYAMAMLGGQPLELGKSPDVLMKGAIIESLGEDVSDGTINRSGSEQVQEVDDGSGSGVDGPNDP